jgi:hypothetical protein
MHILVTNDDGIASAGLHILANAMRPFGDVTILAPDRNWSASGHVKTLDRPLRVKQMRLPMAARAMPVTARLRLRRIGCLRFLEGEGRPGRQRYQSVREFRPRCHLFRDGNRRHGSGYWVSQPSPSR